MRRYATAVVTVGLALVAAACGSSGARGSSVATAGATTAGTPVTLRLGYFPNVTHAPAIVGLEQGLFAKDLGATVTLKPAIFNAGPEAVEALNAD